MANKIYRKIWEQNNGKIPVDDQGRTYEIHHKDGNNRNNTLENLMCVSIEEHYAIHYEQGDWQACLMMSERMKLTPAEKSELASRCNRSKIFITDGVVDKKINSDSPLPIGWRRGRTKGKNFGPRSEEFRKKMSELKRGKPLSAEHKESLKGLIRGMTGKKHTEETKRKMSKASKGIPKSEKHKRALSLAKRKKN